MLDDFFSHKIHASDLEDWQRKLVKLAEVFASFDNQPFDRNRFDQALNFLSPTAARSPFRDIYSIYIPILGVGHIVWHQDHWLCKITETASRYLLGAEPNVEAFCKLQLSLYQRPDARGQKYNTNGPSLEPSNRQIILDLANSNYRICPFRLILKIFEAKARLLKELQDSIFVTPEEIYTIANQPEVRSTVSPSIKTISQVLEKFYEGEIPQANVGRKTFAFLESTGLLEVEPRTNNLRLYQYGDFTLNQHRNNQIEIIKSLEYYFDDFNRCTNYEQVCEVLESGRWAEYFDACKTFSAHELQAIAGEILISSSLPQSKELPQQLQLFATSNIQAELEIQPGIVTGNGDTETSSRRERSPLTPPKLTPSIPPLKRIGEAEKEKSNQSRRVRRTADPESTRILKEKRNAWHEFLVKKMADHIRRIGGEPFETDLIDLITDLDDVKRFYPSGFPTQGTYLENSNVPYFTSNKPESLSFIFEMKSCDDSIITEQIRKAVSQLYEYRYKYYVAKEIRENAILVIVLQTPPHSYPWLKEYLLFDRHIAVCWLRQEDSEFECFNECRAILEPLIAS